MMASVTAEVLTLIDALSATEPGPARAEIVKAGHPVLRNIAREVDSHFPRAALQKLMHVMEIVLKGSHGVGLAAPQLGIPLRVVIMEDLTVTPGELAQLARELQTVPLTILINPVVRSQSEDQTLFYEGCLSLPGYQAAVKRALSIDITHDDMEGNHQVSHFEGWPARIVQHEIDHLNGHLYIDKSETRSISHDEEYSARWAQPTPARARSALGF